MNSTATKKYFGIFFISTIFLCVSAGQALSANAVAQEDRAEILLRALWAVGDQTINPDNQHCNLGDIYRTKLNPEEKEPVKIKEPLIAAIAEMSAGGDNKVKASCGDKNRCNLSLSHAKGEDISSTEYRFSFEDGKIRTDTLQCISTP